jgi:glutamate transport system substrate-binding protein
VVETVSANREPFIQNGQVDIVVATYTINDKRKEVVSFAGPYYMADSRSSCSPDNDDIESEEISWASRSAR